MKIGRYNFRVDPIKAVAEIIKALIVWGLLMVFFTVPATFSHLVAIFLILVVAQATVETTR